MATTGEADTNQEEVTQTLEDQLELLSEKRYSTREKALSTSIYEFQKKFQHEFLEKNKETLLELLKKGLKKGTEKEQKLSADLLVLVALTLGLESEPMYKEFGPILEEIFVNSNSVEPRCASIAAFGMLCFISNQDEMETVKASEKFTKLFKDEHQIYPVRTASLNYWNLLSTIIPPRYTYDHFIPDHFAEIVNLLKSSDLDLKLAAGESIALLFEVARFVEEDKFHIDNLSGFIDTDDLLDTLYELSGTEKARGTSKKDKLKQRSSFKEVKNYIESGDFKPVTIEIKFHKLEFNTWSETKQLEVVRDYLGIGLHVHFESNPLIHDIFDFKINPDAKKVNLTGIEKRMYMSPSSPYAKGRTQSLNKQRQRREQAVEAFLSQDD